LRDCERIVEPPPDRLDLRIEQLVGGANQLDAMPVWVAEVKELLRRQTVTAWAVVNALAQAKACGPITHGGESR
jgi:hypothetical protein